MDILELLVYIKLMIFNRKKIIYGQLPSPDYQRNTKSYQRN